MCRHDVFRRPGRAAFLGIMALVGGAQSEVAAAAKVGASQPPKARLILDRPVTMQKVRDLDFATLSTTANGTAVVDPNTDAMTTTGGVRFVSGTPQSAVYRITSSRGALFVITLPSAPITLKRSGGTETMTVSNWTTDGSTLRLLLRSGSFDFRIGGRLNVNANQAQGSYSGTFTVTSEYF